jgi:hypothetical protein
MSSRSVAGKEPKVETTSTCEVGSGAERLSGGVWIREWSGYPGGESDVKDCTLEPKTA